MHEVLSKKCNTKNPTEEYENNNKEKCDNIYSLWCDFLKQNTRKNEAAFLVQEENINYGFRRNLYGMRHYFTVSIVMSFFMLLVNLIACYMKKECYLNLLDPIHIIAIILNIMLIVFRFKINENWVKVIANEYAIQLHLSALKKVFSENETSKPNK